jgi:GntR family transcriptional regulator
MYPLVGSSGQEGHKEETVPGSVLSAGHLYQQIVNDLRDQMRRGELAPGDQIPTEAEMMEHYHVSRNTVRKAIDVLTSAGLLDTATTRGTFVRERRPLTITATRYERERGASANDAYRDELEAQRRNHRTDFTLQIIPATEPVAARLKIEPNALVVCRKILLYIDNRTNAIQDSYYPMDIAEGTPLLSPEDVPGGTIRLLKELGHEEVGHRDEISPRMPTEEEDRLLQLGTGVPVLEWIRTAYTDKRPVRLTWSTYAGDGIQLIYELGDLSAVSPTRA